MKNKKYLIIIIVVILMMAVLVVININSNKTKTVLYNDIEYEIPKELEINSNSNNIIVLSDKSNIKYNVSFGTNETDNNLNNDNSFSELYDSLANTEEGKKYNSTKINIDRLYEIYNSINTDNEMDISKTNISNINVLMVKYSKDKKVSLIFETKIDNICTIEIEEEYNKIDKELLDKLVLSFYDSSDDK